jgi:hypothetical protein
MTAVAIWHAKTSMGAAWDSAERFVLPHNFWHRFNRAVFSASNQSPA